MAPRSMKHISNKKVKKDHSSPARKTIKKKSNAHCTQQIENSGSDSLTKNIPKTKPSVKHSKPVGLAETKQNMNKIKILSTTDCSRSDNSSSPRILRSSSRQINLQKENTGSENCISSEAKKITKPILDTKVISNNGTEYQELVIESKPKVRKENKISKCRKLVQHSKFERNDVCFAKMTGHAPWPAQILEIRNDSPRVWVYFFGDRRMGEVFKSQLYDFETYYKEEYLYDENKKQSAKSSLRHKAVLEVLVLLGQK